jgi:sortase (surface protein transpeptidase)
MPAPVRVTIPAIGVSAPVIPLGLNGDGTARTPDTPIATGWFAPGPEPGEKGAAVIIGHVDSYKGPGVFYHLRALRRGDRITITLRNHRRVRFIVTGSRQAPKSRFPTAMVFARTKSPTLRLVTCGGLFDRSTRHYLDNYIVFARLVGHA